MKAAATRILIRAGDGFVFGSFIMIADDGFIEDMIPYVEFADNANERTPCVLVLDCSGSMRGEPIKQLNAGLKALEKETDGMLAEILGGIQG